MERGARDRKTYYCNPEIKPSNFNLALTVMDAEHLLKAIEAYRRTSQAANAHCNIKWRIEAELRNYLHTQLPTEYEAAGIKDCQKDFNPSA